MMKKFVKTDLTTLAPKRDKLPNSYRIKNDLPQKPRQRANISSQQKVQSIDLRKYFLVTPMDERIKSLIEKFPNYFAEISLHPEQIKSGKLPIDSFRNGFGQSQLQQQNMMPDWQSEGEVELGGKISQQIINKVQHIAARNIGQLKQYEKEFLQEEFRNKLKIQGTQSKEAVIVTSLPQVVYTLTATLPSLTKPAHQAKSDDSDQEVDIKRIVHINHRLDSTEHQNYYRHEEHLDVADDEEDDSKFKDSSHQSDKSDDDIFGQANQSKQAECAQSDLTATPISHGQIKFATGEFSMFALSHGIAADQPLWSITNENMNTLNNNLTSQWMDHNYVSNYMGYCPLVCFDPSINNYIPYSIFQTSHDIKFFQSLKFMTNCNGGGYKKNQKHPQQVQQPIYTMSNNLMISYPNTRKHSDQDVLESNLTAGPSRKYSNSYKPKPQK